MNDNARTVYKTDPTICADEEEEGVDDGERILLFDRRGRGCQKVLHCVGSEGQAQGSGG